jgi:hypothetical protein
VRHGVDPGALEMAGSRSSASVSIIPRSKRLQTALFPKKRYSHPGRPHRFDYFSAETITNRRFSKKTITGPTLLPTRPTPRTNP